jgi:hypothetical protein
MGGRFRTLSMQHQPNSRDRRQEAIELLAARMAEQVSLTELEMRERNIIWQKRWKHLATVLVGSDEPVAD